MLDDHGTQRREQENIQQQHDGKADVTRKNNQRRGKGVAEQKEKGNQQVALESRKGQDRRIFQDLLHAQLKCDDHDRNIILHKGEDNIYRKHERQRQIIHHRPAAEILELRRRIIIGKYIKNHDQRKDHIQNAVT